MRIISPFVDFSFKRPEKLGKKNKAKLTKVFNSLSAFIDPKYTFKRDKNKGHISTINRLFGTPGTEKGYFIPVATAGKKPKVKWKSGNPTFVVPEFPEQTFIPVDMADFADEPEKYILGLIDKCPDDAKIAAVSANGVLDDYGYLGDKKQIIDTINGWINQYGVGNSKNNHDMSNWFTGIQIVGKL